MNKNTFIAKLKHHSYDKLIAAIDAGKTVVTVDNDAYHVIKDVFDDGTCQYLVHCTLSDDYVGFTEDCVDDDDWVWEIR